MKPPTQFLCIVLLSIIAAIIYGIVHDQVTARICVEYFTVGHPPVFATADPTLLGFGWGIIATWWAGATLGVLLAIAARCGSWPTRSAQSLLRSIVVLLILMAISATFAGIVGYGAARAGWVRLLPPMSARVPANKHIVFLIDAWAHSASYLVGLAGGFVLVIQILISRRRQAHQVQQ